MVRVYPFGIFSPSRFASSSVPFEQTRVPSSSSAVLKSTDTTQFWFLSQSIGQIFIGRNGISLMEARSHLGSFGLAGHLALQPVRLLSGGQKARLALAVVMWKKPHILILDEPTNHLDMDSLRALAIGLNDFQGAVLLVSHNQSFLSSISHELWSLDGGKVKVKVGIERNKESFNDLLNEYY
eukprot:g11805.t1